jgi:hypothetical protein
MKKLLASVGVLALAAGASAQNSGDANGALYDGVADYTTGNNANTWKVANPSGPSDWWNSYKAGDLTGVKIGALVSDFVELNGTNGAHQRLGVYPDLGAGVPDIANPAIELSPVAVNANDAFNTDAYYAVPKTTLTGANYHVAAQYVSGDSHCWISSDSTAPIGRTFFTASSYAGGATAFTTEIDLYVGSPHSGAGGTLLFNGSTNATVDQDDLVCVEFFGSALNTRFIFYFCVNGNPFLQLLPAAFTVTDNFLAGPCPFSWAICANLTCNVPVISGLEFCTIWADQTDLKANGKAKLKVGASAIMNVTAGGGCPTGPTCFGQKDDCILDGNIWKVQNPAGPSDWFSVNHGVPTSGVTSLTSASVSSFDFCAIGACWAEVGIYPSNLTVDPTGTTPDVANPLASVTGASACMAIAASDGSCPLTVYNAGPVAVGAGTANGVHVAAHWPSGDSCIWLGSDTDGIDSVCGTPIPSNGQSSLFTANSYTSPGAQFTGANWMMQINWN